MYEEKVMSDASIRGSCLCGAMSFALVTPLQLMVHCHCSRCRNSSGTGHATNITVDPRQFHWLSGEADIVLFDLPDARSFGKWFCGRCGCPVPRLARSGKFVVVPAGSLDSPRLPIRPTDHIFWESRAAWHCPEGGLPTHAEYPEAWG
jgi:hypothetical protein